MRQQTSPAQSSAPRPATAMEAASIRTWEYTADVVVVGFGVAGAAAAAEAAAAGADVLVLERTSSWGGAAAMAGGFIYLGGGTPIQRACGFDDTPEAMAEFLTAAMGPGADAAKIELYSHRSVEHFDWLVSCGVPFRPAFWDRPSWEPFGDHGLMYSGGESAAPFADVIPPAPRGHIPQMQNKRTGERGGGYMLIKPLVETALHRGVHAEYDVRFERLVVDTDGSVVGVVAKRRGEEFAVRARRSVVLAAGSFAYNEAMVAQHVPALIGRPGSAIEQHDGQAIRAAQAVGADLAHMHACEAAIHADPGLMIRGIVVNSRGQRIINEDTYPGRIGQAVVERHGSQAFVVVDERAVDEASADRPSGYPAAPVTWVSDDVAELEESAGIAAGALQATIEVYNRHAAEGRDPVWGKAAKWLRPLEGAIGVYDVRGQTSGFPVGGVRTDIDGSVLDVDGQPIAGLRAAGRTTLGIAAGGYASGASLGDGSFFGRRAGRAAAADPARG